jgi:phospholipid/cholesterol/gamma-HCH transport system substrate-binding protein
METRARYVLIGLFTILGFLSAFGFVLWLAKVQLDRTYAQYDLLFETVSGLSPAAAVTYNGIDVGRVLAIDLDRDDPALVRVRIEIAAGTPIRADTVGTLSSQGVTGVAYISLEGGTADSDPLRTVPPADVPVIRTQRSVVQDLLITGPDLLAQANALIAEVRGFATPENREAIAGILANLRDATGRIDALATRAEATLDRVDSALVAAEQGFASADGLLRRDLPAVVADVRSAVDSTTRAMEGVRAVAQGDVQDLPARIGTLIDEASIRIEALATRLDGALAAAESSFSSVDTLLDRDIPDLVAGVRTAVDSTAGAMEGVRTLTQGTLPQLSIQIGALIQDASKLVSTVDSLARRIGSDPGRFLLGNDTPEYRRSQ